MSESIVWDKDTKHLAGGSDQLVNMLTAVRDSANDCLRELHECEREYLIKRAGIIERYNTIAAHLAPTYGNADNVTEIIPRVPSGVRQ